MIIRSDRFNRLVPYASRMSLTTLIVIATLVLVGGCMQSTSGGSGSSEGDEPEVYVYKGRKDQLMSEPVADRTAKLSERFKLVQGRQ